MAAELTELTEAHRELWQPPVPSQVLQFVVTSAAIHYTAEKAIKHVEEGESGLEQAVEGQPDWQMAVQSFTSHYQRPRSEAEEQLAKQKAMQMVPFFRQLIADIPKVQEFFGAKVEYEPQPYSVKITLQTPPGQKDVFFAPGANVPPGNGSWRRISANADSLRYVVLAYLDGALSSGQVALQHASDRLGSEASLPLRSLINAYVSYAKENSEH
ncbi:hypothetical protein HYV85_03030 [Candidatus Woesearchaeota archaeon]|nr:hypothetical protein [Candidatus Woesearchaeota archaeon]